MTEVITVKFKGRGKQYYFSPDGISVQQGQHVIVDTAKGMEYAEVIEPNHEVPDDKVVQPLRRMIRIATDADKKIAEALGIKPGSPLMFSSATANDLAGSPLVYAREYFRADKFRFLISRGR